MSESINPPPPGPPAHIFARIQNATDHELRTVLAGLCADEATRKQAVKLFSRLEQAARAFEEGNQPPPALYICLNCKGAYSEAQNTAGACHYHPGIVVINNDSEVWEDCDPEQMVDDEDMREEFPEAFSWTCCDQPLDTVGCKQAFHRQGGAKTTTISPLAPPNEKSGNKRARRS
ncbi:hypothetical protein B0I37DRAFT_414967 [Chaetomium sp. MPI-CAGE-AT-0009]|nr:hypothetical protein B0I37DRAFT_414967 [Chaetomium sp. MPI-CAGE-AT-0009]